MSDSIRWGIIGAGGIAGAFARAIPHSRHGHLQAIASRSQEKADAFGETHDIAACYGSYEELLDDGDVDAVYIAVLHPMHVEWAVKAAQAGKHILCEKPIGMNCADATRAVDAAKEHDVFLMEGFMYRCHPQTEKLVSLLRAGDIGEVRMIRCTFGFDGGYNLEGRILKPALGGGAILDVGCYTVSMARMLAGVALGCDVAEPLDVHGVGCLGAESRVDEWATAVLRFENNIVAQLATAVRVDLDNEVHIYGSEGTIRVQSPWFCSGAEGGKSSIFMTRRGAEPEEIVVETDEWLYATEADHLAENLSHRQGQFPAMSWADTLGNMAVLDTWLADVGVCYDTV